MFLIINAEKAKQTNKTIIPTHMCLHCTLAVVHSNRQGSRCLLEICVNRREPLCILHQWHEKCVQYKTIIPTHMCLHCTLAVSLSLSLSLSLSQ